MTPIKHKNREIIFDAITLQTCVTQSKLFVFNGKIELVL